MGVYDLDAISPNYSTYERELKEREHIIQSCPIDVYCSSINPRWGYPYKLMSYWEARESVRDSTEHVIIDSGFRRYGDIEKILDEAQQMRADFYIIPDVTPWFEEYEEYDPHQRAREAWMYADVADRRGVESGRFLPLHRPIEANLDAMEDFEKGNILERYDGVAIGLKKMPVLERVNALATINARVGQDMRVHALSPGTELEMIGFLRENPHMVSSLDVSTPENASANNKVPDHTWYQHVVPFPSATDISTVRAMRTIAIALQLNLMLGPLCSDEQFNEIIENNE